MPRQAAVRVPLAPLLERAGPFTVAYTDGRDGDQPSPAGFIERAGISRRTFVRWSRIGIPADEADRLACEFGFHPLSVWGETWTALAGGEGDG